MDKQLDLTSDNFYLVTLEDGNLCTTDAGQVCLQHKTSGMIYYAPATQELLQAFNSSTSKECDKGPPSKGDNIHQCSSSSSSKSWDVQESTSHRAKWTRDSILALIDLREQYEDDFQSTNVKHDITWKKISKQLQDQGFFMSPTQCNDKWKYLKGKYTQKKDNMGSKGSGESPVHFEFFDNLDKFLGQKHNVKPIAVASSVKGDTIAEMTDDELSNDLDASFEELPTKKLKIASTVVPRKKQGRTIAQSLLNELKKSATVRENNRERRHNELIETRNRAINVFSEKMDMLFENMNKKE